MKKRIFLFILSVTFLTSSMYSGYFDFLKKLTPASRYVGVSVVMGAVGYRLYNDLKKINNSWYYKTFPQPGSIQNYSLEENKVIEIAQNDKTMKMFYANRAFMINKTKGVNKQYIRMRCPRLLGRDRELETIINDGSSSKEFCVSEKESWPSKREFRKSIFLSLGAAGLLSTAVYTLYKKVI